MNNTVDNIKQRGQQNIVQNAGLINSSHRLCILRVWRVSVCGVWHFTCVAISSVYINAIRLPTVVCNLGPVHTGPDPYGHHINLKSLKMSMTLKFVIILQNLIKVYHRKSGKSNYDRKLTELDVETTRIRSRERGLSRRIHNNGLVSF